MIKQDEATLDPMTHYSSLITDHPGKTHVRNSWLRWEQAGSAANY